MSRIELDKGDILVTKNIGPGKEGFIISITRYEDDGTFGMHVKISTETGDVYNLVFPMNLLEPFKGMI